MVKTPSFDKNGKKKGAWSPEEDDKLRGYINRYGIWNWRLLPKYAGLPRCGKSCRLRWMNYLCPNVKRGDYTQEEENIIMDLHAKLGNKWSAIAAEFPGRTDNDIKNHWHTHLKKHQNRKQATPEAVKELKANIEASHQESNPEEQVLIARSQCEPNPNSPELVPGEPFDTTPAHSILESSPVTSEHSCREFSSLTTCDYAHLSDVNWVAAADQENISSSESYAEPVGDFWSEPFFADTQYNQNEFESTSFVADGRFMTPSSSYYYDYGIDLFHQLQKDFPQI